MWLLWLQHAWLTNCRHFLQKHTRYWRIRTLYTIACPGVSISHSQPHSDGQLKINDLQNYYS
jgi:hypothetical protein